MYFTRPNCESRNRQTPIYFWIEIHRVLYFIHSQSLRTVEEKMMKAEDIVSRRKSPVLLGNMFGFVCLLVPPTKIASVARNHPARRWVSTLDSE
jgi:hypothetical protein